MLELEGPAERAVVEAELTKAGVVNGIDEEALLGALVKGTGGRAVRIAVGIPPVPARPARIELDFELDQQIGTLDSRSLQIDYRERGGMRNARAGDRLGTWYPAEEGKPGVGVDGQELAPVVSTEPEAKAGAGVRMEPEGDGVEALFAEIDGVVRTTPDGELFVTDLLEIDGDVDLTVGNIDVRGSVRIRGTVRSGFRVHARHDIEVGGAIEDAEIEAGKTLTVSAGILGGGSGVVRATEQVRAKFAQNATIHCRGDVVLEADIHSTIECGGTLLAREGAGHLRGGSYSAGAGIWARTLGSSQGAPTRLQVGVGLDLFRDMEQVRSELQAARARTRKLQRERGREQARRAGRSLTREHALTVRRAMKSQRETAKATAQLEARMRAIKEALEHTDPPFVRVEQKLHAGVELQIQDAFLLIDHSRPGATFRRDPATRDITWDH